MKQEIERCTNWIKGYFKKAHAITAVVGISGGVDSAVTATLCVKALGSENVLGAILPCDSPQEDEVLAIELANKLNISIDRVDLEEPLAVLLNVYGHTNLMTIANTKARLRMTTLYMLAGDNDGLVVGTTNKTEALIGYMTKYGDGGVDLEPLMEFYKTEIFKIAKILDIPQEIIDRAPSAGLWEGQTDENEIGFKYKDIDKYLINQEYGWAGVINTDLAERIDKLIAANKHKSIPIPHFIRNRRF